MKKQIITVIGIIACVALCAAVLPRSNEVGDLPAEPVKTAIAAEIEARLEETSQIFVSVDMPAPVAEAVVESESQINEVTAEKETAPPTAPTSHAVSKSAPASTEPKSGDRTVIDGKPHIWIPGFGWIVDEGGGSVGTTVGNPGDVLTGNKVGSDGDINK